MLYRFPFWRMYFFSFGSWRGKCLYINTVLVESSLDGWNEKEDQGYDEIQFCVANGKINQGWGNRIRRVCFFRKKNNFPFRHENSCPFSKHGFAKSLLIEMDIAPVFTNQNLFFRKKTLFSFQHESFSYLRTQKNRNIYGKWRHSIIHVKTFLKLGKF